MEGNAYLLTDPYHTKGFNGLITFSMKHKKMHPKKSLTYKAIYEDMTMQTKTAASSRKLKDRGRNFYLFLDFKPQ